MPQSLRNCTVHLIFSTKNREPFIDAGIKHRLFEYMGAIWNTTGGSPILINGPADHVHVLASMSATCSVADGVSTIKSNSSRWIHETFPSKAEFAWQAGYAAFSVSRSAVPKVRAYIENQEEHHRTVTFQDEYRAFLKRHQIEFDERYMWD